MVTKRAFTLIELLVVMAIAILLVSLLMPALARARQQARILQVNAELYQIGLALEQYGMQHRGDFPPTRNSCMMVDHYFQIPDELVEEGYLPGKPDAEGAMSSGMEDPFNPGKTYKYLAVGDLILNDSIVKRNGSRMWVPDGFPDLDLDTGAYYKEPQNSPVRWVLYSLGPRFDGQSAVDEYYPVCRESWYEPKRDRGVLTRVRLKEGRHVGTFE